MLAKPRENQFNFWKKPFVFVKMESVLVVWHTRIQIYHFSFNVQNTALSFKKIVVQAGISPALFLHNLFFSNALAVPEFTFLFRPFFSTFSTLGEMSNIVKQCFDAGCRGGELEFMLPVFSLFVLCTLLYWGLGRFELGAFGDWCCVWTAL